MNGNYGLMRLRRLIGLTSALVALSGCSHLLQAASAPKSDVVLPSGLGYSILVVGSEGAKVAKAGDVVSVEYVGRLTDGTQIDASRDRGAEPFELTLGIGQVIDGWDQGIVGMRLGEQRRLVIPPLLGYGTAGAGGVIPPDATLVFDIDLVDIK